MSQEQLQRVQELVAAGHFAEARAILQTIDHPAAADLLQALDAMEQATGGEQQESGAGGGDLLSRLQQRRQAVEERTLARTEADGTRVYDAGTYQMLWDCQYCGTTGLLGLTHRFCPSCGAAQNPDARYYPSEDQAVAVEDHEYTGTDQVCPSCDTLNGAKAEYCGNCGAPLTAAARAKTLAAERRQAGAKFESSGSRDVVKEKFDAEMTRAGVRTEGAARRTPSWLPIALIVLAVIVCGGIAASLLATRDATVTVAGHSWTREIRIEQFAAVNASDWCDSVPGGAYNISSRQEVRDYRQVPDGEECSMVRVDSGDGTFRMEEQCQTRYRSEPIYDDKCYFSINQWQYRRVDGAAGNRLEEPYWPQPELACANQTRLGCEREAGRSEQYVLIFRAPEGDKTYECPVDYDVWRGAALGSRWNLEVGSVLGDARCGSLERAG